MTVAVFYCRYIIDKDVVESFYKESLFLVEYSLYINIYIYIYIYVYIYIYIYLTVTMILFKTKIEKLNLIWDKQINFN